MDDVRCVMKMEKVKMENIMPSILHFTLLTQSLNHLGTQIPAIIQPVGKK